MDSWCSDGEGRRVRPRVQLACRRRIHAADRDEGRPGAPNVAAMMHNSPREGYPPLRCFSEACAKPHTEGKLKLFRAGKVICAS